MQETFIIPIKKGGIYYPAGQELESIFIGQAELAVVEATAESTGNTIVHGALPDILQYNLQRMHRL